MNLERFEFLKDIAGYFKKNPQASSYLGVSRQTCFSLLALHFSTPEEILDPTARDFPQKVEEKVGLFEKNFSQNQPFPKTLPLPQELETTTQSWQEETVGKPPPQIPQLRKTFDGKLRNLSLDTFKKIKPEWTGKIAQFLGKGKFLGKIGRLLGKAAGPIAVLAIGAVISAKLIKEALKYLGGALYALYAFFSALGIGALIGFVAGAIAGGIAGGIGGAILGAKLGAAIGLAVGGPIGAVIGGILGGFTGFVIGALGGAAIGGVVFGALGYALEHWVWQPTQAAWTGMGNALGGLWSGVGNLASGFLTGAANFLSGGLSAIGGGITTTGSFFAGLATQFSTISLPSVALPVFGSIGIATGGTLIVGLFVVGTAFMRQPDASINPPPPGSEYIEVTKSGQFSGNLGDNINYTLTLRVKEKGLENVGVTDTTTFSCTSSPPTVSAKNFSLGSLTPGETRTLTYQTGTNNQFNNCAVTNAAVVTFNVPSDGKTGQTASASFTVSIGSPPSSGCPVNNGVIICGSYNTYNIYGCAHCDGGYIEQCSPSSERAQAIDVRGPGGVANLDVFLPTLFGQNMQWEYVSSSPEGVAISNGVFWGWEKRFRVRSGGDTYGLRLLHLNRDDPSLNPGQIYPSGTKVGTIYSGIPFAGWLPHIHITASLNGLYLPADTYFKFCGG